MTLAAMTAAALAPADAAAMGRVGVLMGGRSAEREVSLRSGGGVLAALLRRGVDAHGFDTGTRSLAELAAERFDRVFIALHGRHGEDGTIQGALELLGIPYTGSGVLASALAMDKIATKRVWQSQGLATPRYQALDAGSDAGAVAASLRLPLIVKPAREGSSLGLTKVGTTAELPAAYEKAAWLDRLVIAEEFVDGDELTCALLSDAQGRTRALPVIRIVAPAGNYDYQNKYFGNETRYLCPSGLAPELEAEVQALAVAAFDALGCRGWGRADVMLRRDDSKPMLLEMNTSPGMTDHSLVPMAARAIGVDYDSLVLAVLAGASCEHVPNADWKVS